MQTLLAIYCEFGHNASQVVVAETKLEDPIHVRQLVLAGPLQV